MTVAIGIDPNTAAAQAAASDPAASAWVAANAGSGKTYVLSRRVIRLLLAGVDPSRILCLTFTKAAAAEMAKRVFVELARWTRLGEAELAGAIAELNGRPADPASLARARQLFARALDTPGGLKIQTIHAFCERLLHQFPFEANVAGDFSVLDERSQAAFTVEARRAVLARAAADPQGTLGKALGTVLGLVSDFTHEASIAEFVDKRDRLRAWTARKTFAGALSELRQRLGLSPEDSAAVIRRRIVEAAALSRDHALELVAVLARGSANDCDAGERLAAYLRATDADVAAIAYLDFFRTEGGEFRANVVTKKTLKEWPGLDKLLRGEIARLEGLLDRLRTAELFESTVAILQLADATIAEYEQRKRRRSFLDFEDLIVASVRLLSRSHAARWVQYKLDRGIDHILVDEAQDTSPRQWQIIRALVEDFFSGETASQQGRSIFAVGDEKQSIFSFQGAAPNWFADMRREIGKRARSGGYVWEERQLHLSFRSVPVILEAVDKVFEPQTVRAGLTADSSAPTHAARRRNEPGRVVVWPAIRPPQKPTTTDWATPLDHLGDESPEQQLAKRIAGTIRGWLDRSETLDAPAPDGTARPIRAGEILVLVRTRGALSDAINRRLRTERVPIAGADRLALTEHIAVMDLCALGRVVLTAEDDLSLAALLRSPLIGLDDDALFALANPRKRTLWESLEQMAGGRADFAEAKARIDGWRAMADVRDPHAFFARILAARGGRAAFVARLGPEALDVLDEFMVATLAYEESNTPSLEGFLDWLLSGETEIKRDTDSLRNEVRVMTVHGAKGLEADIVFLVDNGMPPSVAVHDPKLLPLDDRDDPENPGPLVWNRSIKAMPDGVAERVRGWRAKSEEEYRRLLYVGMTRARDRLYVVGIDKKPGKKGDAPASDAKPDMRWQAIVSRALDPECVAGTDETGAASLEWRPERGAAAPPPGASAPQTERMTLPPWASEPVTPPAPRSLRLTPSTAAVDDDAMLPARLAPWQGADGAVARRRGEIIHRLLQSLPDAPPRDRAAIGSRYLAAAASRLPEAERADVLHQVLAVLAHDGFAQVFAPGSRAEVDIAGALDTARGKVQVLGRIDRLAITAERVLIVDYKSNRPAPALVGEVPPAYIAQLALYRAVLRRLYPGRSVEAALLWTEQPALMTIPAATLDAAETAILGKAEVRSP